MKIEEFWAQFAPDLFPTLEETGYIKGIFEPEGQNSQFELELEYKDGVLYGRLGAEEMHEIKSN